MIEALPYPTDYLDTLHEAALGYLRRHSAEHLGEQQLFERAVQHLSGSLEASKAVAENIVSRAYAQMRNGPDGRYLDLQASSAHLAMLVDPSTGMHYAIPVSMIFERLIGSAPKTHVRLVPPASNSSH